MTLDSSLSMDNFDPTDVDAIAERRKQHQQQQKELSDVIDGAFRDVWDSQQGKIVSDYLRNRYYFYKTTYDDDHAAMALKEGQRMLVVDILKNAGKLEDSVHE